MVGNTFPKEALEKRRDYLMSLPKYPNYKFDNRGPSWKIESNLRIKRNGVWYDRIVINTFQISKEQEEFRGLVESEFLSHFHKEVYRNYIDFIPSTTDTISYNQEEESNRLKRENV